MINLEKLIDWLGPQGAIAGLESSDLTIAEIIDLFPEADIRGYSKMKREEVVTSIVLKKRNQLAKTPDELMEMDSDSLKAYFLKIKVSREEILALLDSLDIRPGSIARKNLTEFAAREISDIGMYKRVAKGGKTPRDNENKE